MRLSPLNQRRWRNFCANRRAYWSLMIFSLIFVLSLFAEFIANDKPINICSDETSKGVLSRIHDGFSSDVETGIY